MVKVENLIALYYLGHSAGQMAVASQHPQATPLSIIQCCGMVKVNLEHMIAEEPDFLPFAESVHKSVQRLLTAIETIAEECRQGRINVRLTGTLQQRELINALSEVETTIAHEMNAMPIWFVTPCRGYSTDILINNAEQLFGQAEVNLLSAKTISDIREAGRAIAFELITAVGFHAVRAVEAVARGYHEIIVGAKIAEGTPLGPLIQALRVKRDSLVAAKKINGEDLLHLVIDVLARINNVYRKPITHPDMTLTPTQAINVFEAVKNAIALMLEDAPKKSLTPIPTAFF